MKNAPAKEKEKYIYKVIGYVTSIWCYGGHLVMSPLSKVQHKH